MTTTPTLTEIITAALRNYGPALTITPPEAIAATIADYVATVADTPFAALSDTTEPDITSTHDIGHGLMNLLETQLRDTFGNPPNGTAMMIHHLSHHLANRYHFVPRTQPDYDNDED